MKQYVYDGTKYVLHEDVVGLSELPTPSVEYLDKVYLLTSDQSNYKKGNTYKCFEVTPATDPKTYEWIAVTNGVTMSELKTVAATSSDFADFQTKIAAL